MKALVVWCHPDPVSLTAAAAASLVSGFGSAGFSTRAVDLYREAAEGRFDPVLAKDEIDRRMSFDSTVQSWGSLVRESGVLCFVHPEWWGGPPALLKGFVDRVFSSGTAYEWTGDDSGGRERVGLLAGKRALVVISTDRESPEDGKEDPLAVIWRERILSWCGVGEVAIEILYDARNAGWEARSRWIERLSGIAGSLVGEKNVPPDLASGRLPS